MSMILTMEINGDNYTDIFEYTNRSESMRRVQGNNGGIAKNGEAIYDDLAVKYDLTTSLVPARPAQIRALMQAIIQPTCTVRFFSFIRNSYVTQTMRVENLDAVLGLLKSLGTDPVLGNIQIKFVQK